MDRDEGGNVHEQAVGRAGGRLELFAGRIGPGPLGRVDEAFLLVHPNGGRGELGLGQEQSGTSPDQVVG